MHKHLHKKRQVDNFLVIKEQVECMQVEYILVLKRTASRIHFDQKRTADHVMAINLQTH